MTAIALAVALYRADHDGRFPDDLNALVPEYLSQIPLDPFSKTNSAIQYVKGNRRLLYSVGADGIDDTAAGAAIPDEPQFFNLRVADLWLDLQRRQDQ
jgi:hypothetical protein